LSAAMEEKDRALTRRAREVAAAEQRSQADLRFSAKRRLRIEAERTCQESALTGKRAEIQRQVEELAARDSRHRQRESQLHELLRAWGQRRRRALEELNEAVKRCQAERGEWATARDAWLREIVIVVDQRRQLTEQSLAIELSRGEPPQPRSQNPLVQKRLERLKRQWISQFDADVRVLNRLRDTVAAEAARLDETAEHIRDDRAAAAELAVKADERLAELDADRAALAAERLRVVESAATEQDRRLVFENQLHGLRDEVEGLARLLIEAPRPLDRAA